MIPGAAFQVDDVACPMQEEKHAVQFVLMGFDLAQKLLENIIKGIVGNPASPGAIGENCRNQFNLIGLQFILQFIQIHAMGDILSRLNDEILNFAGFCDISVGFSD